MSPQRRKLLILISLAGSSVPAKSTEPEPCRQSRYTFSSSWGYFIFNYSNSLSIRRISEEVLIFASLYFPAGFWSQNCRNWLVSLRIKNQVAEASHLAGGE